MTSQKHPEKPELMPCDMLCGMTKASWAKCHPVFYDEKLLNCGTLSILVGNNLAFTLASKIIGLGIHKYMVYFLYTQKKQWIYTRNNVCLCISCPTQVPPVDCGSPGLMTAPFATVEAKEKCLTV